MKMQAMVLRRHGGPEVLDRETIDLGAVAPRRVRVRVRAVAMNHMDLWVRRGLPHVKLEYPHRLGCDIVGEVAELGPGADAPPVGTRVFVQPGIGCGVCARCVSGRDNLCRRYHILGESISGGYGEYLDVPDSGLVPLPDSLAYADAAALPLCTLTAWQMIVKKAKLVRGETVLVHAAGSGVSSIAIQICKLFGARVVATAGSPEKVARAIALGADLGVDYTKQDFVAEVRAFTGKAGVDVVLDHVGGEVIEKSVLATAWGGRIVTCGATAGAIAKIDMKHVFFRQIDILGSTMGSRADLWEALPHLASGAIRPVVDRVMSLWDAREAHVALESRAAFGKIVLTVDG